MYLFLSGIALLVIIISLFWLKDRLRKPLLARFVYSGLVARLAVLGAVFVILGFLLMAAELVQ
jgi:hypothetical protein